MQYTVLTLFPEIIDAYFSSSIMAKAIERGLVGYKAINIRDYAFDKHRSCDDAPYGGGPGMLMLAEPLGRALEAAGAQPKATTSHRGTKCRRFPSADKTKRVIYLSPSGKPLDQALARDFAAEKELILLCGRYEGIDQRIIDTYVDDEVSVGDYVLSSGEVAALVLIDVSYRLLEQVITPASLDEESFSQGLLEYPQYTRPIEYANLIVPEVLLSGHHENIRRWRLEKRVERTLALRPDLIRHGEEHSLFSDEIRKIIEEKRHYGEGER